MSHVQAPACVCMWERMSVSEWWWSGRRWGQTGGVKIYKLGGKCLYPWFGRPPLLSLSFSLCVFVLTWESVCICLCGLDQAPAQSDSQQCIFNRAFPPGCQAVLPWQDNSPADAPTALPTQPTLLTHNLLPWSWWREGGDWSQEKGKKKRQ